MRNMASQTNWQTSTPSRDRRCAWRKPCRWTPIFASRRRAAEARRSDRPDTDDRRTLTMRRAGLLLFVATAAGCQFSENRYLTRTVRSEELVGSWQATEFAIKSLRDVGVSDHLAVHEHTLVLKADGSCSIRTIMNVPPIFEPADYRTYATGCRWRLARLEHQALQFDLTPLPPSGAPYYYFDEEDGRLILWQYATDPDAWRYMEFVKTDAQ